MKKLLLISSALGLLLFGLFTIKAIDYYQKDQAYQERAHAAGEAGALTVTEHGGFVIDEVYFRVDHYTVDSNGRASMVIQSRDSEALTVYAGDTFELNGKQLQVYDIFENEDGYGNIAILGF